MTDNKIETQAKISNKENFAWLSGIMFLIVMALDFTTSFRGPFRDMTRTKRIWRSFAVMVILFFVYLFGSITASVPAMIKIMSDNIIITEEASSKTNGVKGY